MGMTRDKMEFAAILAREVPPNLSVFAVVNLAQKLTRLGATHNRLAVEQCNREWTQADEVKRARIRMHITKLCDAAGFPAPMFQNDPRGCTVKLRVPSGYTNDWGREGVCVPTA